MTLVCQVDKKLASTLSLPQGKHTWACYMHSAERQPGNLHGEHKTGQAHPQPQPRGLPLTALSLSSRKAGLAWLSLLTWLRAHPRQTSFLEHLSRKSRGYRLPSWLPYTVGNRGASKYNLKLKRKAGEWGCAQKLWKLHLTHPCNLENHQRATERTEKALSSLLSFSVPVLISAPLLILIVWIGRCYTLHAHTHTHPLSKDLRDALFEKLPVPVNSQSSREFRDHKWPRIHMGIYGAGKMVQGVKELAEQALEAWVPIPEPKV